MIRRIHLFLLMIIAILGASPPVFAQPFISYAEETGDEVITLALSASQTRKVFFLQNPDRLVVDAALTSLPSLSQPHNSRLIKSVRAGRFDPQTVRMVFDLMGPTTLVDSDQQETRLTLRIDAAQAGTSAKPAVSSPAKPAARKAEKPLIVIDPGHGGQDPGAIGPRGSQEKDIVLAISRALRDELLATGKYRVKLTRDSDRFIPLRERVGMARKAGGAIFLSIHADSAPGQRNVRGLSVYTLSERASDAEAQALADRENKSDIIGGMDLSHEKEEVADILISLAQRDTRNQSGMLADMLVGALDDRVTLLPNPHRFAGFAVLKAPDIPSVLIETGFISSQQEETQLKSKAYRDKLTSGIVSGIDRYFARRSAASGDEP